VFQSTRIWLDHGALAKRILFPGNSKSGITVSETDHTGLLRFDAGFFSGLDLFSRIGHNRNGFEELLNQDIV
jgi:hypothetical protein